MRQRLHCLFTKHRGGWFHSRKEWKFGYRIVWMNRCLWCSGQLAEGNSDGWIIPQYAIDLFIESVSAQNPWRRLSS